MLIEDKAVVLFQGDSITDAGRDKSDTESLGTGYAMMAASWFSAMHPEKQVRFINRGIGGNRAKDLAARWEADCIELKPTWVSIMIGINDTWRAFDSKDPTGIEAFEADCRRILTETRERLGAHLVLIEPFVLPVPADRKAWRVDLDPRIHAVRALAGEFGAILVPMDGIMNAAASRRPAAFWAPDGVHPTPAGHALMAQAWLRSVGA